MSDEAKARSYRRSMGINHAEDDADDARTTPVCTFCGKTRREIRQMVAAQDRPAVICDECIGQCIYMLKQRTNDASPAPCPLNPGVNIAKAREAQRRLVNVAFRNRDADGEPIHPRFHIPVEDDDDDMILRRALDELEAFRAQTTRTNESFPNVKCIACEHTFGLVRADVLAQGYTCDDCRADAAANCGEESKL